MEEFIVDNIPNEAVFIMKIAGDSMYDEKTDQIKDNSVVVINPRDTLYEDKIVIANLDGEIVCKRYSKVDDHIEFLFDNELHQNENKDSRDYRNPKVIGGVLGVIEDEKFIPVK
jgi:SOS-response transcriptional repressor LexA